MAHRDARSVGATAPDAEFTVRLWSLSDDALIDAADGDASVTVVTKWGEFDITDVRPRAQKALRRMCLGPISLQNVIGAEQDSTAEDNAADVADMERVLVLLSGSVVHSLGLHDGLQPLLSIVPLEPTAVFHPIAVSASLPVRLSRFDTMRPNRNELVLESPSSRFRVVLHRLVARSLTASLVGPLSIREATSAVDLAEPVVAEIIAYLVGAGVAMTGTADRRFAEDDDPALHRWHQHELLFHKRSRSRQSDEVSVEGLLAEPGALVTKPVPDGPRFPLYRPNAAAARGPLLGELLETDHSCPKLFGYALTSEQLGELLFRSARVRRIGAEDLPTGMHHEASQRPYFNIACLYELELYLTVNRCAGLPRGIYHYDPLGHALTLINDDGGQASELLDMAKVAAASTTRPPVLITVTARLERTSWMLGGAAYAAALMHVGSLQQVLYLTGKAIGFSAHAILVDDSDAVERALRLRWPVEVAVGECVLGA